MAQARTRTPRIRCWAAALLGAGYAIAFISFWVLGAAAYMRIEQGASRFLGFAYLPILLLPAFGRGTIGAVHVHSPVWLWWFALQMTLGVAAIVVYPFELRRRTTADAERLSGVVAPTPPA